MPEPTAEVSSRLWRFFANPIVGIVGSIASVIGVALAILFYLAGIREPRLTYYVHPVKSMLASPGENSRLTVFYDKQPIQQAVTVAQVAFWNAGKTSIRRENILQPLAIVVGGNSPILEARLRKVSRDIVQVEIDQTHTRDGILEVKWNILEFGDGGILEIVFLGTAITTISGRAVIEGQANPERLEFSRLIRSPAEQYRDIQSTNRIFALIFGGAGVFMILVAALAYFFLQKAKLRRSWVPVLMMLYAVILLVSGLYEYLSASPPGPPFGF
jgi:hypothetical protein